MKIITKARYQWNEETLRYELVAEESFTHQGPCAMAGGGPSAASQAASKAALVNANSAADTSTQMLSYLKQQQQAITPFATNLMTKGAYPNFSDYASAQNNQSWAPAQAQLNRQLSSFSSLPSGYATQAQTNLAAQRAQSYDQNLFYGQQQNENSKLQGAQLLAGQQVTAAPAQWNQTAASGYNSVIQSPQTPGLASVLGGVAGAGLGALGNIYCWIAAAHFGGWSDPRSQIVRRFILGDFRTTWYGRPLMALYGKYGRWVSRRRLLVKLVSPLFRLALHRALEVDPFGPVLREELALYKAGVR